MCKIRVDKQLLAPEEGCIMNFSKPAVTAVSYPIRAGKFSNSHVPIPDWIECGAGRFTPIHTSLEIVRSPRGPRQSEWRQISL
jgi:hypothetical protein